MIERYLQALLEVVAASPIVRASDITLDKRVLGVGLIRGDMFFSDGSRLHFRELVESREDVVRLMYSFHYQSAERNLLFRYDDTPHHPGLSGFPHHKHVSKESEVIAAVPPTLADVLRKIESMQPIDAR